jgi:drug/metabolite transporter (DMT)-like permease
MKSKIFSRFNPGVLALLGAMLIWGLTFIATKIALKEFQPFTLTVIRLVIAWAVLYPFARRAGYRMRDTFQPVYLWFGFTGVAFFYAVETLGIQITSAASGSLIQAGLPALTAIFSYLFLKERLSLLQIGGVSLAVLGVVLITLTGASDSSGDTLLGNLLIVCSSLSWVAYTILGKKWALHVSPLVTTTASMAVGFFFLLPFGIYEVATSGLPHPSAGGIGAMLYLALGGMAAAYFLWNIGLRFMDANAASPYINLIPVIGLVGAMLWGEPVSLLQLGGGAVAIVGVWLSGMGGRKAVEAQYELPIERMPEGAESGGLVN